MDLYYLLAGLRIDLPPLKKRPEDLEDMLQATFQRLCENLRRYHVITNGGMELLKSLDWPGNIIQINAFLERLVLTARHRSIDETAIRSLYDEMFPPLAREAGQPRRTPAEPGRPADSGGAGAQRRKPGRHRAGAGHQHHHPVAQDQKAGH